MVMQKHILCVSYDEFLLVTRRMLLEKQGYKVTPALTSQEATTRCRPGDKFDLFILGHSIPPVDQATDDEDIPGAFAGPDTLVASSRRADCSRS
jgi:CheY-like chemotaxis protein